MHKITQTWKGRESQVTYNLFLRGPALQSPKPMLSEYGISKHLNFISKSRQSEKEFQPFSHQKTKRTHYFSKCTFFLSPKHVSYVSSLCAFRPHE